MNFRSSYIAIGAILVMGFAGSVQAAIPIERWQQASGAQVYFVPSPGLPMVDVQIDFDAGERLVPAAQAGLAQATASMLQQGVAAGGGQPAMDENQLGEAWADLGASFGASASNDRFSVNLRSLTDPKLLTPAVQLAAHQLGHASFPDAIWQRDRARWTAGLKEALTRPGTVAALAYQKAVFGSHPYGQEPDAQTLAAIGVTDMQAWRDQRLAPCRAKATVVGAVDRAQADALVQTLLAQLPAASSGACPAPAQSQPVPALTQATVVNQPFAAAQAQVLMGQPGYARQDPRHFAFFVGNHILGEGFTSRLVNEVREKRGLSYSVGSDFSPGLAGGSFTIGLQTKPEQAQQALKVAQDVLRDYVTRGPTEAEMNAAKANLTGSFPLRIDSNRKLLLNVANIAWNNLPLDYLDTWTRQVNAVTAQQVKAAFGELIHPDRLAVVLVGAQPAADAAAPAGDSK
ncbi:peptidase M16 [Comamonas serinivorans]|uniref:Peptidase M16 n=1 Tax=Comamonas serinivorans TaxID=1082851 RepID=A0A1Y0EQJ0_9BURK|nr:pitrilysin family protein [Comamonas serinivorans]ARU05671.1 peptidase M16 [Comamonas serinivorans]